MLRIGSVPYRVALPLTEGLAGHPGVYLHLAPPAELVRLLACGKLDIALASSILAIENLECKFWHEGPVIASQGPVRSVLLFLRSGLRDPRKIQSLTLDSDSRTGQALTHIILQDGYQTTPQILPEGDGDPDAILRIGDPALAAAREASEDCILDLGQAWQSLTAMPFVYAGWICRPGFPHSEAAELLTQAAENGLAKRSEIAKQDPFMERYLQEDIRYSLPAEEIRTSLKEFGARWQKTSHSKLVSGNPEAQAH